MSFQDILINIFLGPFLFLLGALWAIYLDPRTITIRLNTKPRMPLSWVLMLLGLLFTLVGGIFSVLVLIFASLPVILLLTGKFEWALKRKGKNDPPRRLTPPSPWRPRCPGCGGVTQFSEEENDHYCWNCEEYISAFRAG